MWKTLCVFYNERMFVEKSFVFINNFPIFDTFMETKRVLSTKKFPKNNFSGNRKRGSYPQENNGVSRVVAISTAKAQVFERLFTQSYPQVFICFRGQPLFFHICGGKGGFLPVCIIL